VLLFPRQVAHASAANRGPRDFTGERAPGSAAMGVVGRLGCWTSLIVYFVNAPVNKFLMTQIARLDVSETIRAI
jgi:hypothetical protein